jgi:Ras-related protein Rab-1A
MIVKEKIVKVQIWDTAGQERYRSITNAYYRGAEAIIIVFDLQSKDSFNHIQGWIDEISKYTGPNVFKLIIGNKCDIENPQVTKQDISELEKKLDIKIMEVSAKLSNNVDVAFRHVVESLIER